MKKAILVATCVAAVSAFTTLGASAQTSTGPAAQQDTMSKDKMKKDDGMKKDTMSKDSMKKDDGMKKDDAMSKDKMGH